MAIGKFSHRLAQLIFNDVDGKIPRVVGPRIGLK